jgi:predicted GNAT family N-acyltransferase
MRNVLEQQQVAVVTIGDEQEVVSMAGFELLGKTSDGRPVYEAGRSVTLQEHRKKGYYRQVMERVVEAIRQKSPNAVIVRSTQIDTVEKSCREMGFQSIPPARYVQYKGGEQWENLSERERQGYADWQYFELDLMRSPS